ncbi:hypothetical protein B9Z55_007005 [Caenorhabditis nigoni]|uniref:F-box domain-containing protein n=1 Tax=Caenorhabditis nigoni TaxID=1611254 RepID=A0A2G5V7I0_9PELO|nr:hypothetical protein B9Z55_007005 [Caenorhabditis nigoni]
MPLVSYQALRCIIEHIEANRRLLLSARCRKISRIEKSAPLRIHHMWFMENSVKINHMEHEVLLEDQKMEVSRSDKKPNKPLTLRLYNYRSQCTVKENFSRNYGVEEATRKVVDYLLGGRNKIRVKYLEVYRNAYKNIQYLFGRSNMKISVLTSLEMGLPDLHPIVEGPLKELKFHVSHPRDFENPIVRTAEKIVVGNYEYDRPDIWLETHRNLPNKEVVIDTVIDGLNDTKILELIEYWRETRKAVGSSFSLLKDNGNSIETFLEKVKERFQGTYVKLKRTDKSISSKINPVSIKIDSVSKIVIHGIPSRIWPTVLIKVVAVVASKEA